MTIPLMYGDLASWWPLLAPPEDYAEEAARFREILDEACDVTPRDLLELGCGGGNNALHMKAWFDLTLVDISPAMLEVSRGQNPECEHIEGDMRTLRLGREFDAVFVHDAIGYMATREDLARALRTAALHCRPGGAVLLCPDSTRETWREYTNRGGRDGPDGRAMRFLEWTWDPDPDDDACQVDFAFLLRDADGEVRHLRDRHVIGVFPRDFWLESIGAQGLQAAAMEDPKAEEWLGGCEFFLGRKRA